MEGWFWLKSSHGGLVLALVLSWRVGFGLGPLMEGWFWLRPSHGGLVLA